MELVIKPKGTYSDNGDALGISAERIKAIVEGCEIVAEVALACYIYSGAAERQENDPEYKLYNAISQLQKVFNATKN